MKTNWFKNIFRKKDKEKDSYVKIPEDIRLKIIEKSSLQVSRGVFFSTVIIVVSFLPVFMLTGQEGKLFHPLAYTKTFILIVDAILVLTLAPVLISFFMKGKFKDDNKNPINRGLERIYEPIIRWCMKWKKTTLGINILALLISIPMIMNLGREFMPPLAQEVSDASRRLADNIRHAQLERLTEKERHQGLTDEEKRRLLELLRMSAGPSRS